MPGRDKLAEFTAWWVQRITGDEKGQAQIFLDHGTHRHDWTLFLEWKIRRPRQHPLRVDGTAAFPFHLEREAST